MSFNVTIGLNDETLTALNALTAAIAGIQGGVASPAAAAPVAETAKPAAKASATKPAAAKAKAEEPEVEEEAAEPVTIYWFSSATNTVGVVDSEEAFKALKKKDPKTVKYTESKYNAKLAELEAAEEAADEEATEEDDVPVPTEKDIIAVFGAYLPADLDDEEKAERRPFVKAILDRFDAKKATALPEEHRRLAINLVQRKMAGEDVDVENDEFQEVDEDGLV